MNWRSEFQRLEGAYAPATMRSYYSDVEIFVAWCSERGLPPFPAEVRTVCAFLEAQAPELAPASVRRRLYAIRKAHRLLRLPDPTQDEDINLTLRRVRRAKHTRPVQAKGLTREYLDRFLEVQPETPWGLRNRALLSIGYDILARRSELVALRQSDLTWRADGTLKVLIRRGKADPFGEGRIAFTSRRTCDLVDAWLGWRGIAIEPLFCPIYQLKPINRTLSTTTVKAVIKSAARSAGLDASLVNAFSGHSLRVGAAQDLLCAGHDTAAIMRAGGWKCVNVLGRYLEHAEHNVWL
ncbi:tyrosine-type recombinase/integrase [Psychromarinibacter sediminicola]|nr:tyrosine-type recombinase/integrase [Psychromarinibacter sediminicola]